MREGVNVPVNGWDVLTKVGDVITKDGDVPVYGL